MRSTISAGNTYTVYVGGTDTAKTSVATISASAVEYKVTFMNGTTKVDETETVNGIPQLPTTNPTKDADNDNTYEFAGWCTDEALTTAFDNTKAITSDITVYAKFKATQKPTITHKLGDIDSSNAVDPADVALFLSWSQTLTSDYPIGEVVSGTVHKLGDIDNSGAVDPADVALFLSWSQTLTSEYPIGEVISGDYLISK